MNFFICQTAKMPDAESIDGMLLVTEAGMLLVCESDELPNQRYI